MRAGEATLLNGNGKPNGSNGHGGYNMWLTDDDSANDTAGAPIGFTPPAPIASPPSVPAQPPLALPALPPPAYGAQQFGHAELGPLPMQEAVPDALRIPAPYGSPAATHRSMGAIDLKSSGGFLSLSAVAVGVGMLVGVRFGGLYGGLAGALFGGAAVNAARAVSRGMQGTPQSDREAVISGTYTVVAAGLGGYLVYRSMKHGEARKNPQRSCETQRNGPRNCGIRPII